MKTLQQEVVEALNVAQGFAREQAAHYAIDGDEDTENICIEQMKTFEKLAAKVESMKCENCKYWYRNKNGDTDCDYSGTYDPHGGMNMAGCGPGFGCWNFKEKIDGV